MCWLQNVIRNFLMKNKVPYYKAIDDIVFDELKKEALILDWRLISCTNIGNIVHKISAVWAMNKGSCTNM
jgi:hypothetical protein